MNKIKRKKDFYILLYILPVFLGLSCTNKEKGSQTFSWLESTDSLQLLGVGSLSRSNAEIYNFAFTTAGTVFSSIPQIKVMVSLV